MRAKELVNYIGYEIETHETYPHVTGFLAKVMEEHTEDGDEWRYKVQFGVCSNGAWANGLNWYYIQADEDVIVHGIDTERDPMEQLVKDYFNRHGGCSFNTDTIKATVELIKELTGE